MAVLTRFEFLTQVWIKMTVCRYVMLYLVVIRRRVFSYSESKISRRGIISCKFDEDKGTTFLRSVIRCLLEKNGVISHTF